MSKLNRKVVEGKIAAEIRHCATFGYKLKDSPHYGRLRRELKILNEDDDPKVHAVKMVALGWVLAGVLCVALSWGYIIIKHLENLNQ
jgi:hypothetical protein